MDKPEPSSRNHWKEKTTRRDAIKLAGAGVAGFFSFALIWRWIMNRPENGPTSPRMPVLFFGHGSPMNAIADNAYTRTLGSLGKKLPIPRAIVCVSAHWMTEGTWVTGMQKPKTIHDFYGFPEEIFRIQYAAPGSPETASLVRSLVEEPKIQIDGEQWGLDHGTWAVLRHLYPRADIPVLQVSIDPSRPGEYHYELGRQLRKLRDHGVLVVGSGNIVHNLRRIRWEEDAKPYDWAVEFDEWVKERLARRDDQPLVRDYLSGSAGRLSVPTPDHYLPFLAALGAADAEEPARVEYEELQNGSISMRSISFG